MPFTEIVCPNCLKHVPVDQEQESTFCIYCGKELPSLNKPGADSLPDPSGTEEWDKLFKEGKYSDIMNMAALSIQEDSGDKEARIFYMLAKLNKLYDDYVEDVYRDDERKGTFGQLFSSLVGRGSESPIHESFMKSVVQQTDELTQLLDTLNNTALRQIAAERAIGIMVKTDLTKYPQSVSVAYEMLEKHAVPFIKLLSDTELNNLKRIYGQIGKKRYFSKEAIRTIKQETKARS